MIKSKYIIFNRDDNYYEYNAANAFEAIDKYVLYDMKALHISVATWNKIKDSCAELEERIALLNELCDSYDYRINRIIGNYTYIYGDVITPCEEEAE